MSENLDKRWLYLDALRIKVKTKLKGDPSLKLTTGDILTLEVKTKLARATLERFFGMDKSKAQSYPSEKTRNTLAKFVGYEDYNYFVKKHIEKIIPPKIHTDTLPKIPLPIDHPIAPYLSPCIDATTAFAFRLKEIFEGRGLFLLKNAPQTDFNEYRYISTLYRFSSVLAWFRVIEKEQAFLRLEDEYEKSISKAIFNFRNALADGKNTEILIVRDLCETLSINTSKWSDEVWNKIGIHTDHILHLYEHENQVKQVSELSKDKQTKLLNDICRKIEDLTSETFKRDTSNDEKAITQLARTQIWIYFDWQKAIGDIMLERLNRPKKAYEVISFADFETHFLDENFKNKRWIKRTEKLFADLDIRRPASFDARIFQLKKVLFSAIELIETFFLLQKAAKSSLPDYVHKLKKINFI